MTLTLHLLPEVEARLRALAQARGVDPANVAEQLLQTYLPAVTLKSPANGETPTERDPAFVAVVKSIRGKFAHTATDSATEALHRERQTEALHRERQIDKVREEHRIPGAKA